MGIDYSVSAGYGIVLPEETIDTWKGDAHWVDDKFEEITWPAGLGYDHVGNLTNGEGTYIVILDRVTKHIDVEDLDDDILLFNEIKIKDEEYNLLCDFVEEIWGLTGVYPSFYTAGTIS